jgi:hypothetical protein
MDHRKDEGYDYCLFPGCRDYNPRFLPMYTTGQYDVCLPVCYNYVLGPPPIPYQATDPSPRYFYWYGDMSTRSDYLKK